jgi:hypothetical protein
LITFAEPSGSAFLFILAKALNRFFLNKKILA